VATPLGSAAIGATGLAPLVGVTLASAALNLPFSIYSALALTALVAAPPVIIAVKNPMFEHAEKSYLETGKGNAFARLYFTEAETVWRP